MKIEYKPACQGTLLRHLAQFHILDYESCLKVLDTENTGDMVKMSYLFRPLTRNKYISKSKDGIVSILEKGRTSVGIPRSLIAMGGHGQSRQRVLQVSRIAALLAKYGVSITGEILKIESPQFIPSACWREIAPGILSTTRFLGILLAYGRKYAVYDIGDGHMEWQVRAESSLFYTRYGSYETKADGMILVCDDGKREQLAESIIRQTMWSRKTLLSDHYTERNKPVRFSRSPIKLRTQYERVYLTTPARLGKDLKIIYQENVIIKHTVKQGTRLQDPKLGDIEIWPNRYFINPAYDLLKLVYFFSAVKTANELTLKSEVPAPGIHHTIIMRKDDLPIIKMYPDVLRSERVNFCSFKLDEVIEQNSNASGKRESKN